MQFYRKNTNVKEILEEEDSLPYIWIRGNRANLDIKQMFVIIRKTAVPCTASFCQALDTCFKAFFVFNMVYPYSLEPVWKFLEHGIFRKILCGFYCQSSGKVLNWSDNVFLRFTHK